MGLLVRGTTLRCSQTPARKRSCALLQICQQAAGNLHCPVKYASSRATSCAFSSIHTTPASFCTTFSTSLCALNSGFGSKSKTSTSCPRSARAADSQTGTRAGISQPRLILLVAFPFFLGLFLFGFFLTSRFWQLLDPFLGLFVSFFWSSGLRILPSFFTRVVTSCPLR